MPLREVRLYGELGRRFGRLHRFDVATAGEAVRALMANFPGFEKALADYAPGWHVLAGADDVAAPERLHDPAAGTIKIIPAVAGAKSGWMGVILGVVLIAAAIFMPATIGAISLWGSTTVAGLVGTIGVGMALGGIAQLLSPQPKYQAGSDAEKKQSYVFSGPVNTTQQGVPVPLVYGRMTVGSAVVSMGLSTRDIG
jgi:predicted phage tail protein